MGLHGSLVPTEIPAQGAEKPDGPPCGHSMGNASPWIHYEERATSKSSDTFPVISLFRAKIFQRDESSY